MQPLGLGSTVLGGVESRDGSPIVVTLTCMRRLVLPLLVVACGEDAAEPVRREVAVVSAPSRKLDLLFVIDDSSGGPEMQSALATRLPTLFQILDTMPTGRPNLHVGVVSTDLGTSTTGASGPPIGSGPGSCSGDGKAGVLMNTGTKVNGSFLRDEDGAINYTGTLAEAAASLMWLGASGCGFEQPLSAIRRALDNPTNAGFLRGDARLAIVLITDEDDCSLGDPALVNPTASELGALQSFRCTHWGVTCDTGGATPDAMAEVGPKDRCHANETSPYLISIAELADSLASLKAAPHEVYFAAIAGPPSPVTVELRTPPGGGTALPALAHSCMTEWVSGLEVADPAVRIADLASRLPRGRVESICSFYEESGAAAFDIGFEIRNLLGSACVSITSPTDDCIAVETVAGHDTPIPACAANGGARPCFELADDPPGACETGLRLTVVRDDDPAADSAVSVRCSGQ